jgi:hypothetical protein
MKGSSCGQILRYYPSICLEVQRKTMKNLSQDSRFLGQDLNPRSPKYENGVLTTQPRCLVCVCESSWVGNP